MQRCVPILPPVSAMLLVTTVAGCGERTDAVPGSWELERVEGPSIGTRDYPHAVSVDAYGETYERVTSVGMTLFEEGAENEFGEEGELIAVYAYYYQDSPPYRYMLSMPVAASKRARNTWEIMVSDVDLHVVCSVSDEAPDSMECVSEEFHMLWNRN